MNLYITVADGAFVESPTFPRALQSARFKRRDNVRVAVGFLNEASEFVDIGVGAAGVIGVKTLNEFSSPFLTSNNAWSNVGIGQFTFDLNLNTTAIDDLFADEPSSAAAMLEIQWTVGSAVTSSNTLPVTIYNDLIRGTEASPTPPPTVAGSFQLMSGNGTVFTVTVDNNGILTTAR